LEVVVGMSRPLLNLRTE